MDYEDFLRLQQEPTGPAPAGNLVDRLRNREDRTLLYGYTSDRTTVHVYMKDSLIHRVEYAYNSPEEDWQVQINDTFVPDVLVPNKRLYPEACDAEFCEILKSFGVALPFTKYNPEREPKQFHGEVVCNRALSPAP